MAIVDTKIELVSLSVNGRELSLRDVTEGGYSPLPIDGVLVTLNGSFKGTPEPSKVIYTATTSPTKDEVIAGTAFKINSFITGDSEFSGGMKRFKDGIIDINYYPYTTALTGTGTKDTNYIVGTGFTDVLADGFEAIVVGTELYHLDKTKSTNGGTVIYTVEKIKTSFTSFKPALRTNLKVLNQTNLKEGIAEGARALAYVPNRKDGIKEASSKLIHNFHAQRIWFETEQYGLVETSTIENNQMMNLYRLGKC